MALIQCPECSQSISDHAASCPQCGFPIQDQFKSNKPPRVRTTEDSWLTRNRGCGDILIYGTIIFLIVVVALATCKG